MYPTDANLGNKIKQLLMDNDLENPVNFNFVTAWTQNSQQQLLQKQLSDFLGTLGLYQNEKENNHSAERLVNYWCNELFYGLHYTNFPQISLIPNQFRYTSPLIAEKIQFTTTCEHHLVPIDGIATIAYQPQQYLVGLNKLNCILEFFSHRPQLQERLTRQIHLSLQHILQTRDVAIIIKARHACINTHGIQDNNSQHTTYQLSGIYEQNQALQQHLFNSVT